MSISMTYNWKLQCDHCGQRYDLGTFSHPATFHDKALIAAVKAIGWKQQRMASTRGTGHLRLRCQEKPKRGKTAS